MRGKGIAAVAVAVLIAATACSSSKHATSTTTATSAAPGGTTATTAVPYSSSGPYTVGVTTLTLPTKNAVEVWYPAAAGVPVGHETYDVREFLPPAIDKLLASSVHAYIQTDATRDVDLAQGAFPLVLFSHGYSGFRDQSSFLTTWLASWGMIVAAPDHPSRDLQGVLAAPAPGVEKDTADLTATIDLLAGQNTAATSRFDGHVDTAHIAAVGHSAGGATVIRVAADPRVGGYVSLASGNRLGSSATTPPTTIPLPAKPSLFVAGAADHVVDPAITRATYASAPAPSYLWEISGAGHNAFDDVCAAAQGQGGLIALAQQAGIGDLIPAQLRNLATDGCEPPDRAVTTTWPVIDQVVTAFLRNLFGVDKVPVGLGPTGTRTVSGVSVMISARPG